MEQQPFPQVAQKLRELNGLTQRQLAVRVGASTSSLCRWETGQSTPKRDTVEQWDKELGANGKLLRAWTSWTSGASLPPWLQNAAKLEEAAISVTYISPALVPGLLQSPSYTQMIFREGQPLWSEDEISRLVALRCKRYEYLRDHNNPGITAVFPAIALSMINLSARTEQVERLLQLMDDGVRIHVLPPPKLLMGVTSPLLVARLGDGTQASSSDHQSGNVILDGGAQSERISAIERHVLASALPLEQSRDMLKEMLSD